MNDLRSLPSEIQQLLSAWDRFFHAWWLFHYTLGIAGTIASITVASNPKILQGCPHVIDSLAWMSAICIALITFLMPSRRAKAYVAAWRLLNDACNRYKLDPTYPVQELLNAATKGEEIISSADPT
jgi:hypothetical protein